MDGVQAAGLLQQPFQEDSPETQALKIDFFQDVMVYMHQAGQTLPDLSLRHVTVERTKQAEVKLINTLIEDIITKLPDHYSTIKQQLKQLNSDRTILDCIDLFTLKKSLEGIQKEIGTILYSIAWWDMDKIEKEIIKPFFIKTLNLNYIHYYTALEFKGGAVSFPTFIERNELTKLIIYSKNLETKEREQYLEELARDIFNSCWKNSLHPLQALPASEKKPFLWYYAYKELEKGKTDKAIELIPQIELTELNQRLILNMIYTIVTNDREDWAAGYAQSVKDENYKKKVYRSICDAFLALSALEKVEKYLPFLGTDREEIAYKIDLQYRTLIGKFAQTGEWDNAQFYLAKIKSQMERSNALKEIAASRFKMGEYDRALDIITEITDEKKQQSIYVDLAEKCLEKGDSQYAYIFIRLIKNDLKRTTLEIRLKVFGKNEKQA